MHLQMKTVFRALRATGLAVVASTVLAANVFAQAPAAPPANLRVSNVSILHLNTVSLARSLAFYRDVLGMELTAPLAPPRAGGALLPDPGAMLQTTVVKVPGGAFSMELIEWTGTSLNPQHPRIQDPGEVMLAFNVRDMDAKIEAAKKLGLKVLSKDGVPYITTRPNGQQNKAIMIQDPTGFIVELTAADSPAPTLPQGPISSVGVFITAQDAAQTAGFYNAVFGFAIPAPGAAGPANDRIKGLFGDPSLATMRTVRVTFPGSELSVAFQEFTGPDRKPVRHRVQDPGGPILTMTVPDLKAATATAKANGGTIGDGAESVMLAADARASWVRDPNGLLIRMSLPQPPRAPSTASAAPAQR
jgi:catechol 2,3-dioxygenase-like lactoylglutathione lyase family enzyme